jgi:hypothetical protein
MRGVAIPPNPKRVGYPCHVFMKVGRSDAEVIQITDLLRNDRTFVRVFREDWTQKVLDDLRGKLYGKIPRNFLINIGGLVGSVTGIFKSTLGLQIALTLDPLFNLKQRVAFSINELLDKVKNNSEYVLCNVCYYNFIRDYKGTYEDYDKTGEKCENCDNMADKLILLTKLIFFLDEQTRTLKTGGIVRLQNLVDTCRQRQICFICCGVEQYDMSFTTYSFKRIQESNDDYLPKKRVRYGVYDDNRRIYYGYFQWDITPLTDPFWNSFWKEYSVMKTDFQRVAISQQTQSMNFEEYAEEIIDSEDFVKCFKITKKGDKILQSSLVKNLIVKRYPDITAEERSHILSEIKMMLYDDDEDM